MPQLVKRPAPKLSILDAALKLHAAGWWIVPQAGKRAVVLGWEQFRLSEDDLRDYLSDGRLNIAIVLNQSACVDVECDTPEAEEAFLAYCGGIAPHTPTWASRRGLHRLFLRPDGAPERAKVEVDGIEFRLGNRAALSTVPPSVHPDDGTVYKWLPGQAVWECDLLPLPEPLVKLLRKSKRQASANGPVEGATAIVDGHRNDTLFRYGCRMARSVGIDDVANNLHGANKIHCKPPLEDAEVNQIIDSIRFITERSKTNIVSASCTRWSDLVAAWSEALEGRPDMWRVLAVMLAVAASTSQTGDQLFLQVVGDPGSAKTRFCDAMLVSPKCKRLDKLTGFFSGRMDYDDPDKDYSFVNRANHCTLITAEADILMTSPAWSELMSQQRRMFDGSASASYKNRDFDLEYTGLRMPWIMAGTPTMLEKDQSRLGDRFLRIHMSSPDEDMKRRILRRVGRSAWAAFCQESNCSPDSTLTPEMLRAYRLTGGYVDWLRANVTARAHALKVDLDWLESKCAAFADFTAYMRSRPPIKTGNWEPDYEAVKDLPTRLQAQFVRMAGALTVVLNKREVDDEIISYVRRVALDTSRGRTLTLCRHLAHVGKAGTMPSTLAVWIKEDEAKVQRWLTHMDKVGAVTSWCPEAGGIKALRRWRLTDKLETLYAEVMNVKAE